MKTQENMTDKFAKWISRQTKFSSFERTDGSIVYYGFNEWEGFTVNTEDYEKFQVWIDERPLLKALA
jgi:hypothetical protein